MSKTCANSTRLPFLFFQSHQHKVNRCIQTITAVMFRTYSHLTDHRIKPPTVARVSAGQVADRIFIAAANENEGSDKYKMASLDTLIWCIHKNTTTLIILRSLFLYTYFLFTSCPVALATHTILSSTLVNEALSHPISKWVHRTNEQAKVPTH